MSSKPLSNGQSIQCRVLVEYQINEFETHLMLGFAPSTVLVEYQINEFETGNIGKKITGGVLVEYQINEFETFVHG